VLGQLGIRDNVQIEPYGGKDGLTNALLAAVNLASFRQNVKSFGITRDADDQGIVRSMQSVLGRLHQAKLTASQKALDSVPRFSHLKLSAFILCGSNGKGRLEEMILEAVASDWRTVCIDDFWICLQENTPEEDDLPKDENKARLAVYLASQKQAATRPEFEGVSDEELRLEMAVQRRYINIDHPVFDDLKQFLHNL
jgi:hypothetical protein